MPRRPFIGIYTDLDKPSAPNLVYVDPRDGVFSYISSRYENQRPLWEDIIDIEWFTPLSIFGVEPVLYTDLSVRCRSVRLSRATDRYGRLRRWEGYEAEPCFIRKGLEDLIQRCIQKRRYHQAQYRERQRQDKKAQKNANRTNSTDQEHS